MRPPVHLALVLVVAGCTAPLGVAGTASPRTSPSTVPPATVSPATVSPAPSTETPAPPPVEPTEIAATAPPIASLAAEGGDPMDAQLGTYVWGDAGSDSPWLPGARIAAGSGEPLTVRFRPAVAVASWSARYVPATADGPEGARVLGDGSGDPRFDAPDAGTWTVEVHVTFANDAGTASFFWQLAVD